jgi:hypothetical protein
MIGILSHLFSSHSVLETYEAKSEHALIELFKFRSLKMEMAVAPEVLYPRYSGFGTCLAHIYARCGYLEVRDICL